MKYDYKKKRKKIYALILLLVITIGYALLSTTLKINGVAGIKSNTWNIHWENVQVNSSSTVTADEPVIDTNKTKVTYEVTLELPGDYYEFNVDAKNSGSINGIIDDIRHNVYEEDGTTSATLPEYIKYSIVYAGTEDAPNKGDILEAGEKQTYTIRIEYDSEAKTVPSTDLTYKIVDEIDYVQTSEEKETTGFVIDQPTNAPILGGLNFGDEICIKEECFNVLTSNDNTTKLLAKYNLLVGNTCTDQNTCTPIPTTTEGYGRQSSTALGKGSYNEEYPAVGTIPFSNSMYWFKKVGEGLPYNGTIRKDSTDSAEVYTNPVYVFDNNSNLYPYTTDYLSYLKSIGANKSTTIGLFDGIEANNLFHFIGSGSCYDDLEEYTLSEKASFIINTSFWLGSAAQACNNLDYEFTWGSMWHIDRGNYVSVDSLQYNHSYGVRPVIDIPTSSVVFSGWRLLNPGSTGTNQQYEYWKDGKKIVEGLIPNIPDFSNNLQTYYFKNGLVQYGWQKINDKVYYFRDTDTDQEGSAGYGYTDGNMVYGGDVTIGTTTYTFDNDGVCTSSNCPTLD